MLRSSTGQGRNVARSSIRLAAGTGAVVGFLLIGGTAIPIVAADPGHSHGDNHSGRGDNDSRRGGDGDGPGQGRGSQGRDGQGGYGRQGDGRGDRDDDWGRGDSGGSSDRATSRTGGSSRVADDSSSEVVTSDSVAARTATVTTSSPNARVATTAAVPAAPTPPDGDRGSDSNAAAIAAGEAATPFTPPPVRIGDGRSPGILTDLRESTPSRAGSGPTYVASTTVAPPPGPAPLPPSPPQPLLRTVESLWAAAEPARPDGILWGIAGLLLAPIAGAWLGYRQARASKAAAGNLIKH
jgi:hypothetical protein